MMKKIIFTICIASTCTAAFAQEKWDLRRMVDYATANNISVKQADVQARIQGLQLKQAKYNQLPSLSFNPNIGMQFGRSIDPTTNQFTTTQLLFNTYQLQGGMQLYNFGQIKSNIAFNALNVQAALADKAKVANDIALSVCNFYLQVLASREQVKINELQIASTLQQLAVTKKRVDAGSLPELNNAEIEAQLANDSSNLVSAKAILAQNLISLKGFLNIDMETPFDVEMPAITKIPVENLVDLNAAVVYQLAMSNQPQQLADSFRIAAAKMALKSTKASLYPALTMGYSLGTNFSNAVKAIDPTSVTITGTEFTSQFVNINNQPVFVQQPKIQFRQYNRNFSQLWQGYGSQLDNNFRQSLSFGINVPIFNSTNNVRIGIERSKIDIENSQLLRKQNSLKLQQDIYNAYVAAEAAMQKFYASDKSVISAQKAYDFAKKRYEVGLLPTLDLITNQNNLLRAKIQQLNNQFDYVFKMKMLEFYKGQGLKL